MSKNKKILLWVAIAVIVIAVSIYLYSTLKYKKVVTANVKPTQIYAFDPFDCCGNVLDINGKPIDSTVTCDPTTDCTNGNNTSSSQNSPASANLDQAFDENYWKTVNGFNPSAQDLNNALYEGQKIYDSLGITSIWNIFPQSDPNVTFQVLTNAKTKANMSLISDQFAKDHSFRGLKLFPFLTQNLSKEDLKKATDIVNNLPTI